MDDSWREKPEGCPGRFSLKTATCKECWRKTECTEELQAEMIEMARDSMEAMKAEKERIDRESAATPSLSAHTTGATISLPEPMPLSESIEEFASIIQGIRRVMGGDVDNYNLTEMVKAFLTFRTWSIYRAVR